MQGTTLQEIGAKRAVAEEPRMSVAQIAETLTETERHVRRALDDARKIGIELHEASGGFDLPSVIRFLGFYPKWVWQKRRQAQETRKKNQATRLATDPRALLRNALVELQKVRKAIGGAMDAMRPEGQTLIQFLPDARLALRKPFAVQISVRGRQGQLLIAEVPELGLSVQGRTRKVVIERFLGELCALYWGLKADVASDAAVWATLDQMVQEVSL